MTGAGAAARFIFQDVVDGSARGGDGGNQTEKQRGDHCDQAKKREHREADASGTKIRHSLKLRFGYCGEKQADAPLRDDEPESGADEGEQQTFGQELRGKIGTRGAEGRAYGKFLAARDGTREEQVGDVGAGDEEYEADGTEQNEEQGTNFTNDAIAERSHHDRDGVVLFWIGVRKLRGNANHLGFGLVGRGSRGQATDDAEPTKTAALKES